MNSAFHIYKIFFREYVVFAKDVLKTQSCTDKYTFFVGENIKKTFFVI